MKILLVSDYSVPRGGNEVITLSLRDGLRQRGHDVRLFASRAGLVNDTDRADYHCFGTMSPMRAALWPANPAAWVNLRAALADFQPDVVHVRLFLSQLSPLILPLLRERPAVYHDGWYRTVCPIGCNVLPDGAECNEAPGTVCYQQGCVPAVAWPLAMSQLQLWRRWRGVFNAVVANSNAVARQLESSGMTDVEVIPNGIPPVRPRTALAGQPTIVFAGRLTFEKGVDVLLKAYKTLIQQLPRAKLIIAGQGPESDRLRSIARQIGPSIEFPGYLGRDEVQQLFSSAWVQVVPSLGAEAFGNSAAEAMMRGTATVASAGGGFTEYVQHGHTGLLVPPNDSEALSAALSQLLGDRDYAQKLGQQGRRFALEAFDQGRFLDRFEAIYKRLAVS